MIQRTILPQIKSWIGEEKIIIIKGARQVGKTTLLKHLQKELETENKRTVFFAVDQEIDNPIFSNNKLFLRFIQDQYQPSKKDNLYVFLDEFQYLEQAGLFLKTIFDQSKESIQLIVSGSSSLEISKNSEYLTGRKVDFYLPRLSFLEYLQNKSSNTYDFTWDCWESDLAELKDFYQVYQQDIETHFLEYIYWGGYPEVTTTQSNEKRHTILKEIIRTYIQKDVAGFQKIENITGFNNLVKLLSRQVGNLVNKSELSSTLNLDYKTVVRYLEILQGTFIFTLVSPFVTNLRKELSKMPKVFAEDLGMVNAFYQPQPITDLQFVSGDIAENFAYNQLSQVFDPEWIHFYRTASGSEVDFVIHHGDEILPIEVKFRNNTSKPPVALRNFAREHGIKKTITLTKQDFEFVDNHLLVPLPLIAFMSLNSKRI